MALPRADCDLQIQSVLPDMCNKNIAVSRLQRKRGRKIQPRFQIRIFKVCFLWLAIAATYATAIAASTTPFVPAKPADTTACSGIGPFVVKVTGANKNTTWADSKSTTIYAVTAAIMPVVSQMNRCKAFNCGVFDCGLRNVAGRYRCCLCACHGSQYRKHRQ